MDSPKSGTQSVICVTTCRQTHICSCIQLKMGLNVSKNSMQIHVGDVVRLTSGDPKMTVVSPDGFGAECSWLVDSKEQIAWVSFACMVKIEKRRFRVFQWFQKGRNPAIKVQIRH